MSDEPSSRTPPQGNLSPRALEQQRILREKNAAGVRASVDDLCGALELEYSEAKVDRILLACYERAHIERAWCE